MREDLMMESPPFFFIAGDITDPKLRETKINKNGRLVWVTSCSPVPAAYCAPQSFIVAVDTQTLVGEA
jgi:hypothetical protein